MLPLIGRMPFAGGRACPQSFSLVVLRLLLCAAGTLMEMLTMSSGFLAALSEMARSRHHELVGQWHRSVVCS